MTFNLGYGSTIAIFMSLFLILLGIKLSLRGYHPLVYWLTFTASAIAGTALSDFIDRTLGLGYALGSAILIALLLIALAIWHKKEESINVEYISTSSVEIFYWIAFLIANTLGTAAGDFLADNMGLGFINSAILISAILIIVALCHFFTEVSGTLLFWIAFVLTRPFGATFGDFLTKPNAKGGINLGTVASSIVICVIFRIPKRRLLLRQFARLGLCGYSLLCRTAALRLRGFNSLNSRLGRRGYFYLRPWCCDIVDNNRRINFAWRRSIQRNEEN